MTQELPDRKIVEKALRDVGLSSRQAKRLLSGNWKLIVGEDQAEDDNIAESLELLAKRLRQNT